MTAPAPPKFEPTIQNLDDFLEGWRKSQGSQDHTPPGSTCSKINTQPNIPTLGNRSQTGHGQNTKYKQIDTLVSTNESHTSVTDRTDHNEPIFPSGTPSPGPDFELYPRRHPGLHGHRRPDPNHSKRRGRYFERPIPTTPPPTRPSSPSRTSSLHFHKDYVKDIFPAIAPEVQYLVWHRTENIAILTQSINMAHEQISRLQKPVHDQAAAITKLTTTVQLLRANPPPPPNNNNIPPAELKGIGKANSPPNRKSFAGAAAGAPIDQPKDSFKLVVKKKKPAPLFKPEYTHMNRQVIRETDCPITDDISDDMIVASVNKAITHHNILFLSATRSPRGKLTFETTPNSSGDTGASMSSEINMALDQLGVCIKGVHAKSRWTGYVIHGVPSHIGTTNTTDVSAKMAEEITAATGFTFAQAPRWMNSQGFLQERGFGSIIVMFPGNVQNAGLTRLSLFNSSCRMENALPSSHNTQWFKCQEYGHRGESCIKTEKCGVCAESHSTRDHKCGTKTYPGGANVTTLRKDAPTALQAQPGTTNQWTAPAQPVLKP
ncbi:hypothetical protein Q9L58_010234 [Maublancomyces gigas]|uniref:Gag protein n=1 Tax=Discina gigas TaxID=1032678 RepID=A0ABR3G5N5_9PEZI